MQKINKKDVRNLTIFSVIAFFAVFMLVFLSYRLNFVSEIKIFDGLSSENSDWGNLGSFISGTLGTLAASFALFWLIFSVNIQKEEIDNLKVNLDLTLDEQKKQTELSALTSMISVCEHEITVIHQDLISRETGVELESFATVADLRVSLMEKNAEMSSYRSEIQRILQFKYNPSIDDNDY